MLDLIIKNGLCHIGNDLKDRDIGIKDSQIVEIGKIRSDSKDIFDAQCDPVTITDTKIQMARP